MTGNFGVIEVETPLRMFSVAASGRPVLRNMPHPAERRRGLSMPKAWNGPTAHKSIARRPVPSEPDGEAIATLLRVPAAAPIELYQRFEVDSVWVITPFIDMYREWYQHPVLADGLSATPGSPAIDRTALSRDCHGGSSSATAAEGSVTRESANATTRATASVSTMRAWQEVRSLIRGNLR